MWLFDPVESDHADLDTDPAEPDHADQDMDATESDHADQDMDPAEPDHADQDTNPAEPVQVDMDTELDPHSWDKDLNVVTQPGLYSLHNDPYVLTEPGLYSPGVGGLSELGDGGCGMAAEQQSTQSSKVAPTEMDHSLVPERRLPVLETDHADQDTDPAEPVQVDMDTKLDPHSLDNDPGVFTEPGLYSPGVGGLSEPGDGGCSVAAEQQSTQSSKVAPTEMESPCDELTRPRLSSESEIELEAPKSAREWEAESPMNVDTPCTTCTEPRTPYSVSSMEPRTPCSVDSSEPDTRESPDLSMPEAESPDKPRRGRKKKGRGHSKNRHLSQKKKRGQRNRSYSAGKGSVPASPSMDVSLPTPPKLPRRHGTTSLIENSPMPGAVPASPAAMEYCAATPPGRGPMSPPQRPVVMPGSSGSGSRKRSTPGGDPDLGRRLGTGQMCGEILPLAERNSASCLHRSASAGTPYTHRPGTSSSISDSSNASILIVDSVNNLRREDPELACEGSNRLYGTPAHQGPERPLESDCLSSTVPSVVEQTLHQIPDHLVPLLLNRVDPEISHLEQAMTAKARDPVDEDALTPVLDAIVNLASGRPASPRSLIPERVWRELLTMSPYGDPRFNAYGCDPCMNAGVPTPRRVLEPPPSTAPRDVRTTREQPSPLAVPITGPDLIWRPAFPRRNESIPDSHRTSMDALGETASGAIQEAGYGPMMSDSVPSSQLHDWDGARENDVEQRWEDIYQSSLFAELDGAELDAGEDVESILLALSGLEDSVPSSQQHENDLEGRWDDIYQSGLFAELDGAELDAGEDVESFLLAPVEPVDQAADSLAGLNVFEPYIPRLPHLCDMK